jgi:hypothetical protein
MVSRDRWATLRQTTETITRFNLVLHEYLGIMGFDDSQYRISQKLIQAMSPSNFSPDEWWHPMNPTNQMSLSLPVSCAGNGNTLTFNVAVDSEVVSEEIRCSGLKRTITVVKSAGAGVEIPAGPSDGGLQGTFHIFDVSVRDENNELLGKISYTPVWGQCLVSDDTNCSQSGTLSIDKIPFQFWMVRQ